MTLDPGTIEACAKAIETNLEPEAGFEYGSMSAFGRSALRSRNRERREMAGRIRALASGVDYFSNDPMGVEIDFPDYAPAALTAEERQIVDDAKSQPHLYATAQTVRDLSGLIHLLTTSCPAEVSEDELAAILGNVIREKHGLRPLRTDEIVGESDWDIHRQQARALRAQYIIGRRV